MAQKKRGLVVIQGGKVEEPKGEGKCMTLGDILQAKVASGQVKVQYPATQFDIFGRPY